MDAAAGEGGGGFANHAADMEEHFSNLALAVLSAQDRINSIVPYLISLLPPPFVPAPDADDSSDSDDDHFSLTSSEDEADDRPTAVPAAQDDDGQEHISRLPDDLLSNIISRLPTNEAARTMVLSTRWRCVWAATPLLVDNAHLRAADGLCEFRAVRAVSRCVAAHPGPVVAARVTRLSFDQQEYALQQLIANLAARNIQDLILFNRPWPLDLPLPDDILSCASLTRLYIGLWRWRFPDTTTANSPAFPNLQELGLFHTIIKDTEVDALLAHCPKLKILSFAMAYSFPSCLRIRSRSLRIVVEWLCSFDEVIVEDAPCLERLFFESFADRSPVKIVHAPRLEVLGFLDLQLHVLEIGGIVIRAGMNVRASAMLPSLKILAVKVRFSHAAEAKMLHTLLRCFPRLQTLHVMSIGSRSPDSVDRADFWQSMGTCDCLESHLETLVLHGFQGLECEQLFVSYILEKGKVLKTLSVVYVDSEDVGVEEGPISGSVDESNVSSGGRSGSSSSDDVVMEGGPMSGSIGEGSAPSGGSSGNDIYFCPSASCWSFQNAIDLSVEDPFCVLLRQARITSAVAARDGVRISVFDDGAYDGRILTLL
ncbi:putative FBD-associated F-box protein At5g56440 [Triticum dicoccoides]|uniref:putative FBD-associated F-box protein At5g56440 n=1 Tax=Triticum dicoccoides TaxID=85692 RepID=UPI001891A5F8|nr:putative FBD-associated F-box protein At5g56440 [Triticum dicoccoides]